MPNTLNGMAAAAAEPTFQARVKAAMIIAGIAIAGEAVAGSSTVYQKRQALAARVLNDPDVYVSRFVWATAANTTVAAGVLAPVSISSSTAANPSVVTTAAVHGLSTGDVVAVIGHAVNTAVNGGWSVTVLTTTTFSVPILGAGVGGATGTVTKQPPDADIQFTVNAAWNDIAGITGTD